MLVAVVVVVIVVLAVPLFNCVEIEKLLAKKCYLKYDFIRHFVTWYVKVIVRYYGCCVRPRPRSRTTVSIGQFGVQENSIEFLHSAIKLFTTYIVIHRDLTINIELFISYL